MKSKRIIKVSYRFKRPSDYIDLKKLERETLRIIYAGFLVAVLFHIVLGLVFDKKRPVAIESEKKIVTVDIIRKKRPVILPNTVSKYSFKKKEYVKQIPRSKISSTNHSEKKFLISSDELLKIANDNKFNLNKSELLILVGETDSTLKDKANRKVREFTKVPVPSYNPYEIVIRTPEKEISVKDEMIDIDNLDIGKDKAIIIKDPADKKNIKGYIRVPVNVWGTKLKPAGAGQKAVILFVDGMKYHSHIDLKTDNRIFLENPIMSDYPFIYISSEKPFDLTETEKKNFRNYIESGGFVFADAYNVSTFNTLKQMILDSLGTDAQVAPVRPDHPVYRSYYTFKFPDEIANPNIPDELLNCRLILKGIWLGDRLVGIISSMGYGRLLDNGMDIPGRPRFSFDCEEMRLLVNCIVFSLTREESIAVKYIDYN